MLSYCQLDPKEGTYFSEILIQIRKFSFKKMHLKYCLRNGGHFESAPMCWYCFTNTASACRHWKWIAQWDHWVDPLRTSWPRHRSDAGRNRTEIQNHIKINHYLSNWMQQFSALQKLQIIAWQRYVLIHNLPMLYSINIVFFCSDIINPFNGTRSWIQNENNKDKT